MGAFVFADIAGFAFLAGGDEAEMFGLHSAWTLLHCTRSPGRPLSAVRAVFPLSSRRCLRDAGGPRAAAQEPQGGPARGGGAAGGEGDGAGEGRAATAAEARAAAAAAAERGSAAVRSNSFGASVSMSMCIWSRLPASRSPPRFLAVVNYATFTFLQRESEMGSGRDSAIQKSAHTQEAGHIHTMCIYKAAKARINTEINTAVVVAGVMGEMH